MSQYPTLFPTALSRAALAASIKGNVGFVAVFGPIRGIDTVAGYTAYKTQYTLIILGAIWGLFVATRALRGEEDAGRWELFLAGQTTRARAAAQAGAGLGVGLVALWIPTAVLAVAAGTGHKVNIGAGAAVFFATAVVSATAMFMAVGMLASQLFATRHDANLAGAGVLAGSYLIRMVAGSDPALAWLRWASPLGWIEELRALTGSMPLAFVPIVLFTTGVVIGAVRVAAHRDAGSSIIASRDSPKARTLLLGGQAGLTVRLTRPAVLGWLAVFAVIGLVFGLVTQAAGSAAKGSQTLERVIARLGGHNAGVVAYLGLVFIIAAGLVAIAVAGQVTAMRSEEASGHLDNLLVRSVARWRWLGVRIAVGLGLVLLTSVVTGVAAWIGAITQNTGVGFVDLVKAGINVAPPAVFVFGVGVLAYGLWPRGAVAVTYGLVVWSFLVETIASLVDSNHWLRDTSPLQHLRPAPATPPDWTAAVWLVGLGLAAALVGLALFGRRDLQGA
jgi:ABC-2 type transport system permease protein